MKNPDRFEQRFGFVAVFDTRKQKRRPLAKHLANDQKFMEKHGFILLEKPEPPVFEEAVSFNPVEKKKRGRPKKQK